MALSTIRNVIAAAAVSLISAAPPAQAEAEAEAEAENWTARDLYVNCKSPIDRIMGYLL